MRLKTETKNLILSYKIEFGTMILGTTDRRRTACVFKRRRASRFANGETRKEDAEERETSVCSACDTYVGSDRLFVCYVTNKGLVVGIHSFIFEI